MRSDDFIRKGNQERLGGKSVYISYMNAHGLDKLWIFLWIKKDIQKSSMFRFTRHYYPRLDTINTSFFVIDFGFANIFKRNEKLQTFCGSPP
jgi:hypothetical protein